MPVQSIWMIRISLIYLLAAFVAGALLLIHKGIVVHFSIWSLLQVHIEMALFGWLIQLVLGTAYWILPRFLEGPGRGSSYLAWLMVILLNAGLWIYIFSHLQLIPEVGFLIGRLLEWSAVGLFVHLHWSRIVPYRRGH